MTFDRRATDAPAKVNLFLRVLRRRPDGFRDIETVFQTLDLADRVEVDVGSAGSTVTLTVDGPDLGPTEDNLAWRAASLFRERTGIARSVDIRLQKGIPAGAGLGGGSSDAAAVLRCLADVTGFSDRDTLLAIGAELGSDVPFFLFDTPIAVGRGRGEVLTPLTPLPARPVVVALPPVHVSTAGAYAALAESRGAGEEDPHGGSRTLDLQGATWPDIERLAENDFEAVVRAGHRDVAASLDGLRRAGADTVLLSGSGAASFGLFATRGEAEAAARRLGDELGWPFRVTATRTEATAVVAVESAAGPHPG